MTSPSKRKGDTFERDVVAYLQTNGFPHAERAYGAGRPADVGDIDGIPGVVIEVKNHKTHELAAWVDEAQCERAAARANYGIVIAKRRRHPARNAYAILPLEQLIRLLAERDALV